MGVEVHVALPPGGPLVPSYKAAGITIHPLNLDFPLNQLWCLPKVLRGMKTLVSKVRPDIIHSHFVGTTLTMRLALGKNHPIPRVFQVPGPLHLKHKLLRWGELLTAGKKDYWVGSCEWTCRRYCDSGISRARLFLSYYGTDLENFARQKSGVLRNELGVDSSVKLVGLVAFMYAPKRYLRQTRGTKGHEDLIDAIAICLETEPNLMGVFVGGAWKHATAYEEQVRAYGKEKCKDRAVFLGTRNDVPQIYPDLDVAVHPSTYSENVGGAVESLLAGRPTIATAVGGLPDLVRDGETGWLVPPRRPHLLAQAILGVLSDPDEAAARASRGQALAQTMFDVKRTAEEIAEIYQQIMERESKIDNE